MRFDLRRLAGPLATVALLTLTLSQTIGALREAGAWSFRDPTSRASQRSPYEILDREIEGRLALEKPASSRDPFAFVERPARVQATRAPRPRPVPPDPEPILTAIIYDADPRAIIRFDGRNYTVRANSLFADYTVVRITRDAVVLSRNGKQTVLQRPQGGS